MSTTNHQRQAGQALPDTLAHYAANPFPASYRFAFNPQNQRYLNCAQPYKKVAYRKFLGATLVGVALIVFAAGWAYMTADLDNLLAKEGVTTQATVVDKYRPSNSRAHYLTVEFSYGAANGQSRVARQSVSVSAVFYNNHREGSAVPVVYAPSDPTRLRIQGDDSDTQSGTGMLLAAPLGLLIAALNGFFLFGQLGKRRKLKQGQILTGTITRVGITKNPAGKPVSVGVEYSFVPPTSPRHDQTLTGQAVFPARNFRGRWHIVEPGKPLAVLYRNERVYEVL